jgi:hypothetical protein
LRSSGLSGVPINDEDEDDDDVIILLHFSAAFSLGQCELWLSVINPKLAKPYLAHLERVVDIHSYRKLKPTKKDELIQGIRAFCHA